MGWGERWEGLRDSERGGGGLCEGIGEGVEGMEAMGIRQKREGMFLRRKSKMRRWRWRRKKGGGGGGGGAGGGQSLSAPECENSLSELEKLEVVVCLCAKHLFN